MIQAQSNSARRSGQIYSRASRPQNVVYSGLLAAILAYVSHASFVRVIACYVLILMLYAVATGVNNIHDEQTDIINERSDNPLVSKALTPTRLRYFLVLALASIVVLQGPLAQPASIIITMVFLGLSFAYSGSKIRIMSRGLLAPLLLVLCYGTLPVLLGAAQSGAITNGALVLAALQIPLLLPVILAKDYKDLKGDKQTGKRTPLVLYGAVFVKWLSVAIAGITALIFVGLLLCFGGLAIFGISVTVVYLKLVMYLHSSKAKVHRSIKLALLASVFSISMISYNLLN